MPSPSFPCILRMQEYAACTAGASCHLRQISCYFPRVLFHRAGNPQLSPPDADCAAADPDATNEKPAMLCRLPFSANARSVGHQPCRRHSQQPAGCAVNPLLLARINLGFLADFGKYQAEAAVHRKDQADKHARQQQALSHGIA